jgi:hypothetical protein
MAEKTMSTALSMSKAIADVSLKHLHPELSPYVLRTNKGYAICSPFLTVMEINEGDGRWSVPCINEFYLNNTRHAEKLLAEAQATRNWVPLILFTQRHFRIHEFSKIESQLTDSEFWDLVNDIWTDAEIIWRNNLRWLMVLLSRSSTRHLFMKPEDRAVFESLPDSFTIYRGYQPRKNRDGFSWTLSKEVAEKLSNNGKGTNLFDLRVQLTGGKVRQKIVTKSEVFALTNERDEQEIILLWNGKHYVTPP